MCGIGGVLIARGGTMGTVMRLPQWFQSEIGLALERLLKESVADREGWIQSKRVMRELQDHRNGKSDNHTRLWLILSLELWFRVVVTEKLDHHADLSETLGLCAF